MKKLLFENDEIKYELENEILVSTWKFESLDKTLIQKILKIRLDILKGNTYPFLLNIKSLKNSTKEARDILASKEGCQGALCSAVLISSPASRMISNFFIGSSRPAVPVKMFTDEIDALKWLKKIRSAGI